MPELAVVAPLGLGEPVEVCREVGLGGPGGAVDALQLRVVLVAAPVRGGRAHDLEGVADELGVGQVRAAAQVAPRSGAVAADVVVDGQLAAADLDRRAFGGLGGRALEADQLALVRLGGQLAQGVLVGHLAAHEPLALVDDLLHDPLERLEVVGVERLGDVEVVVEPVADRRPDAELRVGVQLLDGLGQHVGARVPKDGQPVRRVDGHRLDGIAVGQRVGQVAKLAVDPRHDDGPVTVEQLARRGLLRDRSLAAGDGHGDAGGHGRLLGRGGGRIGLAAGEMERCRSNQRIGRRLERQ